jgi:hypothetical protein
LLIRVTLTWAKALSQLENADVSIPGGRIHRSQALLLAGEAAARANVGAVVA